MERPKICTYFLKSQQCSNLGGWVTESWLFRFQSTDKYVQSENDYFHYFYQDFIMEIEQLIIRP